MPCVSLINGSSLQYDPLSILEVTGGTWDGSGSNNETSVIISGDVTLTGKTDCYSLTFETGGHLTINGGARLRVWQGGITNNDCTDVNYLTMHEDSVNDSYGEFLLHPDVTVNNHPLASVEFISKSFYKDATQYQWERFGIPTHNTLTSIECTTTDVWTNIQIFENNAWQGLGWLQNSTFANTARLNKPFIACNLLTERAKTDPAATYVMKGELFGNINAELNADLEWNSYINSYIGKIKTRVLLNSLNNGILLWDRINNIQITEDNVSQYPYICPIVGEIVFKNSTSSSIMQILSYKDLVWDPSFEEEVTPTRGLMKGALTSPKPTEIDTTLEGSGIFTNPEPVFLPEHDEK